MYKSPLEFSRYWAELMAAVDQAPDTGLLVLTRMWTELAPHKSDPRFAPYFDEYKGRLENIISEANLRDFGLDDLRHLRAAVSTLGLLPQLPVVVRADARLWAYIGEPAKAVKVIELLTGESPAAEFTDESSNAGSEQFLLETAINRVASSAPQTARILSDILIEWQAETSALSHDSAWCMLVQLGPHLGGGWGRLLKLKGDVDLLHRKKVVGNGGPSDQVTFAHQLKSADDPAVGGVYDSLAGIRKVLGSLGLAKSAREKSWAVRLEFEGGNHQYHGDSLGLAAGLLAYAGLLKDEFLRHERKLSGEVGFTGGVDAEGHLTPVNNSTLKDKVARAFFSHLKYLVVPKANEPTAREVIAHLTAQYSRRRLHLVAAETIGEVVEDRNLVRPEKLCPAAYIAKGALKYSRATKVQVPLLVVLVGLLGFVIYSKTLGMDRQVVDLIAENDHFNAVNKSGEVLWSSPGYGLPIETQWRDVSGEIGRNYLVIDIDSDGKNEVFFSPWQKDNVFGGRLQLFDDDGAIQWDSASTIQTTYPGDKAWGNRPEQRLYGACTLIPWSDSAGKRYCLSIAEASMPVRDQYILWNARGRVSGPYLHTGSPRRTCMVAIDWNRDGQSEFAFGCTNNRWNKAALIVLDPMRLSGVSPPWDEDLFLASEMPRGSQRYYVAFPETELSAGDGIRNYVTSIKIDTSSRSMDVTVEEGCNLTINGKKLGPSELPILHYILDSQFIPKTCTLIEGDNSLFNSLLRATGRDTISNWPEYLDHLVSATIILHGDTVVSGTVKTHRHIDPIGQSVK